MLKTTHANDDRFIPIRFGDLAETLGDVLFAEGSEREAFRATAGALYEVILQESTAFEIRLADAYATFNPDCDTRCLRMLDEAARRERFSQLMCELAYLFRKANFDRLSDEEFRRAIRDANSQGLSLVLDEERVEEVQLWFRGRATTQRVVRTWRTWFRRCEVDTPIYRRLSVVVKMRGEPWIYLKLFKNIPRMDIEALLPHARVRMNLLDRIKLAGGGAGTIGGSAYKIWGAAKLAIIWSRISWILLCGLVVLLVRTITGYRTLRLTRDATRTQNLYFQNLDNNDGVVHALTAMVCEEEAKEALLAYAVCLTASEPLRTLDGLDRAVETCLRTHFDAPLNFEIADAAETLVRLRLWDNVDAFTAVDLETARNRLTEHWRSRATMDYHERMARARE